MDTLLKVFARLTAAARKQHLAHAFTVPVGTTELHIRMSYEPQVVDGVPGGNLLSLSLFDPTGARGAGHCRDDNNLRLSAVDATPGYVPGALQPGLWQVVVDTHMVLDGTEVEYSLEVLASSEPVEGEPVVWRKGSTAARGAGWYRGDLHSHTIHSDASWDVPELVASARAAGLDFMTLTDHNTVSPLAQMDSFAADDLLTMGGIELTTYYGHALALGLRDWLDWRVRPGERTITDIAGEVEASGGTFVIAHPLSIGDPYCTGCDWRYTEMMPGVARLVEIWNGGPWAAYNEDGLKLWYAWLNRGCRMVATAGTDIHGPTPDYPHFGFNIVYADELSEAAVLRAVRAGHLYLSSGPRLELTAVLPDGETAMMGDYAPDALTLTCAWRSCPPGSTLRLIADSSVVEAFGAQAAGEKTWPLTDINGRWFVVEVRAANGDLCAVTNPIFRSL